MASAEAKLKEITSQLEKLTMGLQGLKTRIDNLENNPSPSMMKHMEKFIKQFADPVSYKESTTFDPSLSSKLPKKFSAEDLPKFSPTDDPRFHLKGFRTTMALKGIDPELFPTVFPLSLEPVCQKWFFSLPEKDTATWEDITHAFMTRYKGNIQTQSSSRELEILKQGEQEGFTAYLGRWKQTAATLVSAPAEAEMVKTFISNLQPKYKDHLKYLGLATFEKVYQVGIEIEDDLLKESTKGSRAQPSKQSRDSAWIELEDPST